MLGKNILNDYNVHIVQWCEGKVTFAKKRLRNMARIRVRLISYPRDLKDRTVSTSFSSTIETTNKLKLFLVEQKLCQTAHAAPRLKITSLGQSIGHPSAMEKQNKLEPNATKR